MLPNYFRTTFRHLRAHPFFTVINLLGLAAGLCVCFLAGLYVQFELSYDSYHEKANRIYRLVTDVETSTGVSYESTSAPMAPAFQSAFPDVAATTRIFLDYLLIQSEDRRFFGEENVAYADPSIFSVFTFPLLSGDPATALAAPLTVVLSETAAYRFFGTTDCQGETLLLSDDSSATVTGVMRDMPYNSHFRVDLLVSMTTLLETWNPSLGQQWARFGFYTYLLVSDHANPTRLSEQFSEYARAHLPANNRYDLALEPLTDVYLSGKSRGSRTGSSVHGDIRNVYIFSMAAAFVLFIACFNFVNLSTALSLQRAKEVRVRKVLGATRRQLVFQFLSDAVLLSWLAFVIALLLSILLLPLFNQTAGKVIAAGGWHYLPEIAGLEMVAVVVGAISGTYPALLLAGFGFLDNPKSRSTRPTSRRLVQKGLVVAQFAVAILLMVATAVVFRQLHYLRQADLGFSRAHKLVVDFHFDNQVAGRSETIRQRLADVPGVRSVSLSSRRTRQS